MRLQMMHTLLPGGLLLHADAPKTFCSQLQSEGTLPLMKVNMDASSAAKRLEVTLHPFPLAFSLRHAQVPAQRNNGQTYNTSPSGTCWASYNLHLMPARTP